MRLLPRFNPEDESEFRKFLQYYRWTLGWIAFMVTIIATILVARALGYEIGVDL